MARPRSENPRDNQVLLRINQADLVVLDAMAAVQKMTPNEVAYLVLQEALAAARLDPLVQEQVDLHARYQAREAAKVTAIVLKDHNRPGH